MLHSWCFKACLHHYHLYIYTFYINWTLACPFLIFTCWSLFWVCSFQNKPVLTKYVHDPIGRVLWYPWIAYQLSESENSSSVSDGWTILLFAGSAKSRIEKKALEKFFFRLDITIFALAFLSTGHSSLVLYHPLHAPHLFTNSGFAAY